MHISRENCAKVYDAVRSIGTPFGLRNGGYRSLYSLSSEKGYHLWGFDLRVVSYNFVFSFCLFFVNKLDIDVQTLYVCIG